MSKTKTEKKYNLKTYPELNNIIDDLPTDNIRKKYNIKTLIKGHWDKMDDKWRDGDYTAQATNNLHLMFNLCKKYKLMFEVFKRRSETYKMENEILKDEISRLNEKYASQIKEDQDINKYKMDAIWNIKY
jgi:hypothetical protein